MRRILGSLPHQPRYAPDYSLQACFPVKLTRKLDKGADTAALHQGLTPFQTSVLSGNVRVVQWFLEHQHGKPMDGCHPSKATSDTGRRTPLQLALASGVPDVVRMLVKEATVHDVKRCWELLEKQLASISATDERQQKWLEIKDALCTKVSTLRFVGRH
jgi:ankyrin repeat protein